MKIILRRTWALILPALLLLSSPIKAQSIVNSLFDLPDLKFERVESKSADRENFVLYIKQPIDHKAPEKGYFHQRVWLSHKGYDRPTVLITDGYNVNGLRSNELTRLLEANHLEVEHRYFGHSVPDSMDYRYLNLEQATADLHRINALFRTIYKGKWVSTGISKGGATTIFYKYFYPEDVDASVPYVAPINHEYEEPAIYTFLDTVGSDVTRNALYEFQKRILKQREEILPRLEYYSMGAGLEFTYVTPEEAFELAVLEYPFSFWQWGHDATKIPAADAPLDEQLKYLMSVSNVDFLSDASMKHYGSHYYQSAQEMGYYGYETEDFKGLLKALPTDEHPHAAFVPKGVDAAFDGSLLKKVHPWLAKNGDRMIYIYGAVDTWSASAVAPSDKVDAEWFMMAGKHHGNARIRNMSAEEQRRCFAALERWLDLPQGSLKM